MAIGYNLPFNWIRYDPLEILQPLSEAKAAVLSLTSTLYQRDWVAELEKMQLKMEVEGTSRIEGAEFTADELSAALDVAESLDSFTRSQRQARAAAETYRWIRRLPLDRTIDDALV